MLQYKFNRYVYKCIKSKNIYIYIYIYINFCRQRQISWGDAHSRDLLRHVTIF